MELALTITALSRRHSWRLNLYADRGDVAVLKTRDKISQLDGLALLATRSNDRRSQLGDGHFSCELV